MLKSTNMHTKSCTNVMVTNSDSDTRFITMVHSIQTEKEFNLVNQFLQKTSVIEIYTKKETKIMY